VNEREKIELLKKEAAELFAKDADRYRWAIMREIDYLQRKYGTVNINNFPNIILNMFDVPRSAKNEIIRDLKEVQSQINPVWMEYFKMMTTSDMPDYFERLSSFYSIDFRKLDKQVKDTILRATAEAVRLKQGYPVLRQNLINSGLQGHNLNTLANTAIAQFDNATHTNYAKEAGIFKFKYDGVLHKNTRDFCRLHLHKIYTLEQLKKMDNRQGLPVETSLGGYNCTHYLTAIVN